MKNKTSKRILSVVLTLTMLASMSAFVFSANALDTDNIIGQVYDWDFKGENGEEAYDELASVATPYSYYAEPKEETPHPINSDFGENYKYDAEKGLTYTSSGEDYVYSKPEEPALIGSCNKAASILEFSAPDEYQTIADFEFVANRNEDGTFPGIVFLTSGWKDKYCLYASDTDDANHGLVFERLWAGRVRVDEQQVVKATTFTNNGEVVEAHDPAGFAAGAAKVKYQMSTYMSKNHKWNQNGVFYYQFINVISYDEDGSIIDIYKFTFMDYPKDKTGAWADVYGGDGRLGYSWTSGAQTAGIYFTNTDASKIENASIDSIRLIYIDGKSEGACDHPEDTYVVENEIPSTTTSYGYSGDTYCSACGTLVGCGTFTPLSECDHKNTEIINKKDAVSCAEPGYTGDTYCNDCKQVIKQGEQITVPHKFGEWIEDEPATVTSEGKKHRECILCGQVENGTIDKLPPEKGDVNADGVITIDDAILVAQYDVGNAEIKDLTLADMNGDGVVTIHDALLIAQAAAK